MYILPYQFLQFVTVAFTLGIAADIMEQETLDMQTSQEVDSKELALKIVNRVWRQLPMNHVGDLLDADKEASCFCKKGTRSVRYFDMQFV